MSMIDGMYDQMGWSCYADADEKPRVKFRVWQFTLTMKPILLRIISKILES